MEATFNIIQFLQVGLEICSERFLPPMKSVNSRCYPTQIDGQDACLDILSQPQPKWMLLRALQQQALRVSLDGVRTKDCNIGGSTERREKCYPHKSRVWNRILANYLGGWLQMQSVVLFCVLQERDKVLQLTFILLVE